MEMKNKTKYMIIIVLMIVATVSSLILSLVPLEQACGVPTGGLNGCTIVQTSEYESTLGIKNAHIGLLTFPILALFAFFEMRRPKRYQKIIINIGMSIASLIAIYFLYIQFVVLRAVCQYCMVVDIAVLLSLMLIIFWDEKY